MRNLSHFYYYYLINYYYCCKQKKTFFIQNIKAIVIFQFVIFSFPFPFYLFPSFYYLYFCHHRPSSFPLHNFCNPQILLRLLGLRLNFWGLIQNQCIWEYEVRLQCFRLQVSFYRVLGRKRQFWGQQLLFDIPFGWKMVLNVSQKNYIEKFFFLHFFIKQSFYFLS